jgi:glycosyltransferase involved in cell wall biosynthesis
VLINALSVSIGGGVTYADFVLPKLMQRLPRAVLLTRRKVPGVDPARTIETASYWATGFRRFTWEALHLGGIVKAHGIDRLFTPYQVATQPRAVSSVCVLRNLEPFFAHAYPYSRRSALRNDLLKHMTRRDLHRADTVIAVSEFARQFAVESLKVAEARLVRIYHGRDESLAQPQTASDVALREQLGLEGRFVLTAGSLLPYRRVEDVIRAFDLTIAPLDPHARLVVAGTGTDRAYTRRIAEAVALCRHPEAVRLTGHVARDQMRALYRGCDLFVSSSEIEACPNIGIEAMTAGCRIVAADAGPAREIYGDGALFYTARDVAGLGDLMRSLWQSDAGSDTLRASAQRRSLHFSWERCAAETAAVLAAA